MIEAADRPSTDEQYARAQHASDLTVTTERRTAADYLIAAGAAHTPLSAALTNLRSEWDTMPKVPKMTQAQIAELAESYRPKPDAKKALKRAHVEAIIWHERQLREQARRLRHMALTVDLLLPWVIAKGISADDEAPRMTFLAVYHWLSPLCAACDGLGEWKEPDTPVLKITCKHCKGAKTWPEPLGAYRIKDYVKSTLASAHRSLKDNIRSGKVQEWKRFAEGK